MTITDRAPSTPLAQSAVKPARRRNRRNIRPALIGAASIVAGLVIWQLAAQFLVRDPLILPSLDAIWERFVEYRDEGTFATDLAWSAQVYALGLLLAIIIGVTVGVAMASIKVIRELLDPWVAVLNATPTVALAPIFIVVFGLDLDSKVAVCTIMMVFPVIVNTFAGFSNTDAGLVETARSFEASWLQVFTKVRLPQALPYLIAALRLAAAHGLVGIVVADLFGAQQGIGLFILDSAHRFDNRGVFVGILLLALAGIVVTYALIGIERVLFRWQRSANAE